MPTRRCAIVNVASTFSSAQLLDKAILSVDKIMPKPQQCKLFIERRRKLVDARHFFFSITLVRLLIGFSVCIRSIPDKLWDKRSTTDARLLRSVLLYLSNEYIEM